VRSWPWPVRAAIRRPRSPWPGSATAEPVIPIIGARKLAQVKDNLACVSVKLPRHQIERLDAVSQIEMGFPHDFFATEMVRAYLSSGGMRDQIDA
jgi:hypothetical protein